MDPFVLNEDGEDGSLAAEEGKRTRGEQDSSTRDLSFPEVLHLLTRKAVLGQGIPEQYREPPWRLPTSLARHQEVNSLLEHSMKTQAATVPGSDDFQDFILSNSRYMGIGKNRWCEIYLLICRIVHSSQFLG